MNFLKKIKEKKFDEEVHNKFVRYGKGEYERLFFTVKKGKDSFKVKSSFDFANSFVEIIADNLKENAEVSGKIVAPRDFEKEIIAIGITPSKYSKRGVNYTAEFNAVLSQKQLKEIYEKFKYSFLLLNIKSNKFKLSTKSSVPKPGGAIKENFCSATLPNELLHEIMLDSTTSFKEAKIKHIVNVTEIAIPKEYENDFTKARLNAKRKGKIIREIEIDGKIERQELELNA